MLKNHDKLSDDDLEDEFEDVDADNELDQLWLERSKSELPIEYTQIQKLLKYTRNGNQTVTVLTLSILSDFRLDDEVCQRAILEEDGIELLLNILDTNDLRSKVAALNILKVLSCSPKFRALIVNLEGIQSIVQVLVDPLADLKIVAAETLANVFRNSRACFKVIQHDGIKNLVDLLQLNTINVEDPCIRIGGQLLVLGDHLRVIRCASLALAILSRKIEVRWFMYEAGFVTLVADLLNKSIDSMVLVPALDALQQCSSESYFRKSVLENGIVSHLIKLLKGKDHDLVLLTHCAEIIQKCAEDSSVRNAVRLNDGLKPLVMTVNQLVGIASADTNVHVIDRQMFLSAMTGAIWKCSIGEPENIAELIKLKTVDTLIKILDECVKDEIVLCNAVGALSECLNSDVQKEYISKRDVVSKLIEMLGKTNQQLLVNSVNALTKACSNQDNMKQIEDADGIRLLWSLLKNGFPDVQAAAATALHACVEQTSAASELVRNFVGGLELLVSLLESPDLDVQSSVCGVIAIVAKDVDNLAVITDNGAVAKLAHLATHAQMNDRLQRHLSEAIANCCSLEANAAEFGEQNAVEPMIGFLKSDDEVVRRMAVKATALLSGHPDNCAVLLRHNTVKLLLVLIGSTDPTIQADAAKALSNIRRFATSSSS